MILTTSFDYLYFAGRKGTIVHYDGRSWRRIESGTDLPIQDIWGSKNIKTGQWHILCAVSPGYGITDAGILHVREDNTVDKLPWVSGRAVHSVWFNDPSFIFTSGSGILRWTPLGKWAEMGGADVIPANTRSIRGIAENDFFVVSDFGHIGHYNGVSFRVMQPNPDILFYSCDYRNNVMVAVGEDGRNAYVVVLRRKER